MKIALCLSGQPRYVAKGYESLKTQLLEKHDVDVYGHFWWNPEHLDKPFRFHCLDRLDPNDLGRIFELYQPIKAVVEKQREFSLEGFDFKSGDQADELGEHQKEFWGREVVFKQLSMYASIEESYKLIPEEKKYRYDWIIRARTDLNIQHLDLSKLDCEALNTDLPYIDFAQNGINDTFWIIKPFYAPLILSNSYRIRELMNYQSTKSATLLFRILENMIAIKTHDWKISIIRDYKQPKHMDTYSSNTPVTELPFWHPKNS